MPSKIVTGGNIVAEFVIGIICLPLLRALGVKSEKARRAVGQFEEEVVQLKFATQQCRIPDPQFVIMIYLAGLGKVYLDVPVWNRVEGTVLVTSFIVSSAGLPV